MHMNTFSDPVKIINQINFESDNHIADFGCGAGAYSLGIARKYNTAKIYGIDVRKEMIERLQTEAQLENLSNIHVVWGDVDNENGSRLRNESMDFVIVANTLFQAEDRKAMLVEAARVLKHTGRLVLIDWYESFGNIGPAEDNIVSEDTAKLLSEESGFIFEKELNAGEHHYGFIARKV